MSKESEETEEDEDTKDNSIEMDKAISELTGQVERINSLYF